ncbi:cysteine-rich motor neuron 1 protein-like [Lytechinus pictus]|uniref:cysteine-rich motor neuron 1 protein-like n=1 Tax=Lytechinus pictus TaxID=7653 RepID=UPI0030BA1ED9
MKCRLSCSLGYMTDSLGCRICRCRTEDQECTPIEACGLYCPLGYATDHLGCYVCKCLQRDGTDEMFLPQLTLCPVIQCPYGCLFGSATDRLGCPTCDCQRGIPLDFSSSCTSMHCPYGFSTDDTGNKVCKCRLPALCPCMRNCSLECTIGRLSDAHGCEICACKPEFDVSGCPVLTTANCPELDMCAYGLASSLPSGCEICVCKTPVTDCPPISREACQLRCQRGFATDENGCEICLCTKSDDECSTLVSSQTCSKTCLFGLATDADGCPICSCKIPAVHTQRDPFQIKSLMTTPCPPVMSVNCALVCSEGYATDQGCEICACQKTDGCPALNVQQCPLLDSCPYGLSTDHHGCQTCSCRQPIACLPTSLQSCSIPCPRGRATDSDGCEICSCRNTSTSCPIVNRRNCKKACTYGYATDAVTLCQVCMCKQPTEVPIAITSFRICEPVNCTNNCPAGFLHDDQGCPSCNCKEEGVTCPDLPMSVCPQQMLCPYGLGMDSKGCPICFCRVESGCYPVSPLTCDLDCQYGYDTNKHQYQPLIAVHLSIIYAGCYPVSPLTCDLDCPYGYATDKNQCETCRCRIFDAAICNLNVSSTCHKKCPYGLATDRSGCEICVCKNEVREISIVTLGPVITCTPITCDMNCEFGLATDTQGCEVCTCKLPMTDDGCTNITRAVCPLMDGCKFGLATNEFGCSICKCKQSSKLKPSFYEM